MKLEATRLTKAQWCEIIAKLSKHAQGQEYEVSECANRKVWDNRENIRQRILTYVDTFIEFESATDFEGFEALHSIVLNIDDQLLCSMFKHNLDKCMMNCDDRLRHFNETLTN